MSMWNLRIIYHDKDKHPWYGVHEVFYNDDSTIFGYTTDAMDVTGETVEELKKYAQMIVDDVNRAPVLIESEIVIVDNDPYVGDDGKTYSTLEELIDDLNSDEVE